MKKLTQLKLIYNYNSIIKQLALHMEMERPAYIKL